MGSMENIYDKILKTGDDGVIQLSKELKDSVGKEFTKKMCRYEYRHGVLNAGLGHYTKASRYFQNNREFYNMGQALRNNMSHAKIAQADLIEAQYKLSRSKAGHGAYSDELRAEAAVELAQEKLADLLIEREELCHLFDEAYQIRQELHTEVMNQYPGGIEDAKRDAFMALARARSLLTAAHGNETLLHIPLSQDDQMILAEETKRVEWALWSELAPGADGSAPKLPQQDKESLEWQKTISSNLEQAIRRLTPG